MTRVVIGSVQLVNRVSRAKLCCLGCSHMGVEWHDSSHVFVHETNVSGTRATSGESVARAHAGAESSSSERRSLCHVVECPAVSSYMSSSMLVE